MVSLIQVFQIEKIIANLHFISSLYSRVLIKNVILESIKFIFWNIFYTTHDLFFKNYHFYNIFPAFWHKKSSICYWNYFKIQNHRGVTSFETWESCSKANFQCDKSLWLPPLVNPCWQAYKKKSSYIQHTTQHAVPANLRVSLDLC